MGNAAVRVLADKAIERRSRDVVKVGDVAVVERYNARRGRVDVKLKVDPNAPTRSNLPVLWPRQRWPLRKGYIGFLVHTHRDSAGATLNRERRFPETPGNHARDTPWFLPFEPIIDSDAPHPRWDLESGPTDYDTFGPNDQVFLLEGDSLLVVKPGGHLTFIPGEDASFRIGDASTQALHGISRILSGNKAWDPGATGFNTSIPDGGGDISPTFASTTVTVAGARVGDFCTATLSSAGSGYFLSGSVTADDTVTVSLFRMGALLSPGSGTLKVVVIGG